MSNGASGTVRSPAFDFGLPMTLYRSARCRTSSTPVLSSTSSQRSPRSSDPRSPVKMAVSSAGRQRSGSTAMRALISSVLGMSTPTLSLPSPRLSASIRLTPSATFWATLPRRCGERGLLRAEGAHVATANDDVPAVVVLGD
jgi:hypothetical protein